MPEDLKRRDVRGDFGVENQFRRQTETFPAERHLESIITRKMRLKESNMTGKTNNTERFDPEYLRSMKEIIWYTGIPRRTFYANGFAEKLILQRNFTQHAKSFSPVR